MDTKPLTQYFATPKGGSQQCHSLSEGPCVEGFLRPGLPWQETISSQDAGVKSLPGTGNGREGGRVACRASGRTKYMHRGCFPEGDAIQRLPSAPYWVDPDPCPAIASSYKRHLKRIEGKNAFSLLNPCESLEEDSSADLTECANQIKNKRKVQKIVKFLEIDRSLKPHQGVPDNITCGMLRKSVTAMFSSDQLTLADRLSIKTAANAESQPCPYCEDLLVGEMVDTWKKARLARQEYSQEHLDRFAHAFSANVERGWNRRAQYFPYVPNGAATESFSRREGGNWNTEEFSEEARVSAVFTKGKYRIVTMYSGYNVSVLTPLHNSLYESIRRKGWLLVGSPTDERMRWLQEGTCGTQWHSFDYESATDNIKTVYVQRAVEILKNKAEGLSEDEVRCLDVVSHLSLGGVLAGSGQPMGSPLSFPLLCLINKTVVDLALTDLLSSGEIQFKEWTGHRCLINGDDLVTKSTSKGSLPLAVFRNGAEIGLKSNWDKTISDPEYGEINSTVFKNCVRQKKTNVSALWMSAEVTDVIGYADESACRNRGFLALVHNNVSRLARQKIKTACFLSHAKREALLSSKKITRALCQRPLSEPPKDTNLIPVVPMPDGYDLSREDEIASIRDRVTAIRAGDMWKGLAAEKKRNSKIRRTVVVSECKQPARKGLYKLLKKKKPAEETMILSCFASAWQKKRKETLTLADKDLFEFNFTRHCRLNPFTADLGKLYGLSSICGLQQMIKTFKDKRKGARPQPPSPSGCPFSRGDGFVSLAGG
ncbi:RNA-dependent RNA polymerase [Erysiphe necator associated ourmia-like virus 39]|nr:RNA-dependent RNA polymerase [Erysiphe necator associated ourmia-like virus 39]